MWRIDYFLLKLLGQVDTSTVWFESVQILLHAGVDKDFDNFAIFVGTHK